MNSMSIKVGVSSCLLGEKVRYDAGHKHDRYITDVLGAFFTFVPVCPEVGCGMPVPREAMRLEGDPEHPRLVTIKTRIDRTDRMRAFCTAKVKELEDEDLCGFIFKMNSPSSGLFGVKVYNGGMPARSGRGIFASAVVRHFPLLPAEEEGWLNDADRRENFIERVFCYRRWKDFLLDSPDPERLMTFHARHKLLLLSHSTDMYREMESLVAHGNDVGWPELSQRYEALFMKALALHATVKKHTNVLLHIMRCFKRELNPAEKEELLRVIKEYHDRLVPLIVPLTLLKHYVGTYGQRYLQEQYYLASHPAELMLRNHA